MRRAECFTPTQFEPGVDPRNHRYMRITVREGHPHLGNYLRDRTEGIGAQQWHTLFGQNRVLLNQMPAGATQSIRPGDRVEIRRIELIHLDAEDWPIDICHSDDDIMAIHKPAGMAVHPGLGCHRGTVLNFLRHHWPEQRYSDEDLRRMPVHRLDRATSGLLVLGLHNGAQAHLRRQFEAGEVLKIYEAWVWGHPAPEAGVIDVPIGRPAGDPHAIVADPTGRFGKTAVTHYQCLERRHGLTRLQLRPLTGRTHQLRIHTAWIGHPIVGDLRYGPGVQRESEQPQSLPDRLYLHARSLRLRHPSTHREIELFCAPVNPF